MLLGCQLSGIVPVSSCCLRPHTSVHLRGFRSDGFCYAGRIGVSWNTPPYISAASEVMVFLCRTHENVSSDKEDARKALRLRCSYLELGHTALWFLSHFVLTDISMRCCPITFLKPCSRNAFWNCVVMLPVPGL